MASTLVRSFFIASMCLVVGCGDENVWTECGGDDDCPAGQRCIGSQCRPWTDTDGGPDGGSAPDADGGGCRSHADCDGGFCVDGACCPSEDRICGEDCCTGPEVCFARACVVPGEICHSVADCEEGQYCEVALGPGEDGGPPDGGPDGGGCLHPAPAAGRCLDLPPPCPGGEPPEDGTVCIPDCEYHSPPGPLDARERWQWGRAAIEFPDHIDVWAPPAVGRIYDSNCDGAVDELDPPSIVFVSANTRANCCHCAEVSPSSCRAGVLRLLDGLTGQEIWSLRGATEGSIGFSAIAVAIGHLYAEGGLDEGATTLDIAAVTGEGYVVIVNNLGEVVATSDERLPISGAGFGWGGGLAIADMDGDGAAEIAYGATVFSTRGGALTRVFRGTGGSAHAGQWDELSTSLSTFADLDGTPDGHLELLAGNTAYTSDGEVLWQRRDLNDGFPGVGDFDRDGRPEAVLVSGGRVWVLDGATGETLLGPAAPAGSGFGGPPTVADFDGDGWPEIGVARANFYTMLEPVIETTEVETSWLGLEIGWQAPNHDFSSSVTGSTVFDFEGDGAAEVVYNDECFLWVYDGRTGEVRFATPTTSFTGTEASLVADVDGDGHAEMLMFSNGADPSSAGWGCDVRPWNEPDPDSVRPAWVPPEGERAYRGLTVFGDAANSWVGTRTLWNQHTYHVSNICDHRDDACDPPNYYGLIPTRERANWTVPWLNNFRQNVQDEGIYNAPDATLTLDVRCETPVALHAYVRNLGAAVLPAGVEVGFFVRRGLEDVLLGSEITTTALWPGQVEELVHTTAAGDGVTLEDAFVVSVLLDPEHPLFHECNEDNNQAGPATAACFY